VLRSLLRSFGRWLAGPTLPPGRPGWVAVRLWLVLALVAPALGMGAWARPAAAEGTPVAELGLHTGPSNHGDPAERTHELPLSGEVKDCKDAQDELRELGLPCLGPCFDLDLAAAVSKHRFADAHDDGSRASHFAAPRNRGPPSVSSC
jgi:hypothetical protein